MFNPTYNSECHFLKDKLGKSRTNSDSGLTGKSLVPWIFLAPNTILRGQKSLFYRYNVPRITILPYLKPGVPLYKNIVTLDTISMV